MTSFARLRGRTALLAGAAIAVGAVVLPLAAFVAISFSPLILVAAVYLAVVAAPILTAASLAAVLIAARKRLPPWRLLRTVVDVWLIFLMPFHSLVVLLIV